MMKKKRSVKNKDKQAVNAIGKKEKKDQTEEKQDIKHIGKENMKNKCKREERKWKELCMEVKSNRKDVYIREEYTMEEEGIEVKRKKRIRGTGKTDTRRQTFYNEEMGWKKGKGEV